MTTIVLKTDKFAKVLFQSENCELDELVEKIIGYSNKYCLRMYNQFVFIDNSGRGGDLCERLKKLSLETLPYNKYVFDQRYGINLYDSHQYFDNDRFTDLRSAAYFKLCEWLQKGGGKLLDPNHFDVLSNITYAVGNGKAKVISQEKLAEFGVDTSITDALALMFITNEFIEFEPMTEEESWDGLDPKSGYPL